MSRLRHACPGTGDRLTGRLVTPENKRWWTLAAVSFGLFMIMLDATVVNVALPAIRNSLHLKLASLGTGSSSSTSRPASPRSCWRRC